MIKYIIFALLSLFFSFCLERTFNAIIYGHKFSLIVKIDLKRLCLFAAVNLPVWLLCLLLHPKAPVTAAFLCVGFGILLCIAAEDIKCKQISNIYLIALLIAAVFVTQIDRSIPWYMRLFGCAMGYLPLLVIRLGGNVVKKQEVLGRGDAFVSGILGLMLGIQNYLLCAIITCVTALIAVRIIRRKKQYDNMHTYPFSPFFLSGYTISILLGETMLNHLTLWLIGRM